MPDPQWQLPENPESHACQVADSNASHTVPTPSQRQSSHILHGNNQRTQNPMLVVINVSITIPVPSQRSKPDPQWQLPEDPESHACAKLLPVMPPTTIPVPSQTPVKRHPQCQMPESPEIHACAKLLPVVHPTTIPVPSQRHSSHILNGNYQKPIYFLFSPIYFFATQRGDTSA